MKRSKILDRAHDPNLISGIYNYCNRWCERCAFTSRCLDYDGEELSGPDKEQFWEKIRETFEQTRKLLEDIAEEKGIDLYNFPVDHEFERKSGEKRQETEDDELSKAVSHYSHWVQQWFEAHKKAFERAEHWLDQNFQLGIREGETHELAHRIGDAVEVVRWYQHQIYVKLMRALSSTDGLIGDLKEGDWPSDVNGSAKAALIGMDDSIAAWGRLQQCLPEQSDEILGILIFLEKLRRNTEKRFPHARVFLRPGFDE